MSDRIVFALDEQPLMGDPAVQQYASTVQEWSFREFPGIVEHRDVAYGPDRRQRFDVFAPPDASRAPIMVFFHGGGWCGGHKEWNRFMAPALVRRGIMLVTPNYRLAPEHRMPAGFEDAIAVLEKLTEMASSLGGDPSRLYLSGHSAGGHLAALAALRRDARAQANLPSDCVRGCLPIAGILDIHHPAPLPGSLEERVYTTVLRKAVDDGPMSPICWTAGNTVPMLLWHGGRDSERVMRSNERIEALLTLQPGLVERVVEPNCDHFQVHTMLGDPDHPWYSRLEALVRHGR